MSEDKKQINGSPPGGMMGEEDGLVDPAIARGGWGNHLQFILTCIGFSVGLGNIWRFPYLAYSNGGGAFLIPYFIVLILVGIPLYCLELTFGQFGSQGMTTIWKMNPLFKGIGIASAVTSFFIIIYYNVIIVWIMYYFFSSMQSPLPWTDCNNGWNTDLCVVPGSNDTVYPNSTTPSSEFFFNHVLEITSGIDVAGSMRWQLVCLLFISWVIIFAVIVRGIDSLGKASYVISTVPYVLLTCVLIRGATLEGAIDGVNFYITPEWEQLGRLEVWGRAASQIFYSTSIGLGGIITMASYNNFRNNAVRDGTIVPIIETLTSLYAGFVVFSFLGFMANSKGVPVAEVATEGPSLVFVVYPEGLATMPLPTFWAVLFFLMMTNIGFASQFSSAESIISALLDEFPMLRVGFRPTVLRASFCILCFLLGLPMVTQGGYHLFQIMDTYSGGYPLLVIGFMETVAINWVYGFERYAEDIALMVGKKPPFYFKICWLVISPIFILAVFIFLIVQESPLLNELTGEPFPSWSMAMAWIIAVFPMVFIPVTWLIQYCRKGGYQVLKEANKPDPDWGPASPVDRVGRYADEDLRRRHNYSYSMNDDESYGKRHHNISFSSSMNGDMVDYKQNGFVMQETKSPQFM